MATGERVFSNFGTSHGRIFEVDGVRNLCVADWTTRAVQILYGRDTDQLARPPLLVRELL